MSSETFTSIAETLGGKVLSSSRLSGGSSAIVHALELDLGAGQTRKFVHRQHATQDFFGDEKNVVRKEYRLLQTLHSKSFAVAKPWLVSEEKRWLVTDFIEGETSFSDHDDRVALESVVAFLRSLHALDVDELDVQLERLEDPRQGLLRYLPSSERLVRSAIAGKRIALHKNTNALLHGDFWPGNWIFSKGKLAAIIDWEDACIGDPLADLACCRVELLCHGGEATKEAFTHSYLKANSIDTRSLALWDAYVAASALYTMRHWQLTADEEAKRRALTETFLHDALKKVANHKDPHSPT